MKNNFIRTTDKETADKLRSLGFKEIKTSESNVFMFLNDKTTAQFSSDKNISYTNNLCL